MLYCPKSNQKTKAAIYSTSRKKKYLTLLPVLIILTGKVYCLWFKGTFSKNVVGVKLVVMKVWKIEKTPKSYKMLCSLSKKENITTRWVKFQGGSPH